MALTSFVFFIVFLSAVCEAYPLAAFFQGLGCFPPPCDLIILIIVSNNWDLFWLQLLNFGCFSSAKRHEGRDSTVSYANALHVFGHCSCEVDVFHASGIIISNINGELPFVRCPIFKVEVIINGVTVAAMILACVANAGIEGINTGILISDELSSCRSNHCRSFLIGGICFSPVRLLFFQGLGCFPQPCDYIIIQIIRSSVVQT